MYGKNLSRVMRDVAAMVRHGKKQAAWLLRLRTARDRWRWFRIHARPASLREPLRHDAALSLLLEAV